VAKERVVTALASALADYLAVRRAVGYRLEADGRQLAAFVAHLDAGGIDTVTVTTAVEWAAATPQGGNGFRRLTTIRGFARYLQALDPAHEVPPPGLLPARTTRPVPHLYSEADIAVLMAAARVLQPTSWAATLETIIGLLWTTGMRIGEVLRLNTADLDPDTGVLTVWLSKFGKSRLVPLTPSTISALSAYRERVPTTFPVTVPAMFVTPRAQRVAYPRFNLAFANLLDTTGITAAAGRRPRAHDLRHSFAVRTLLGWYRDGADVQAMLPRLSTYLGHVEPSSTYWYLSAAPELTALAAERLEHRGEAGR
jgi:integrase/recombinase XerD